MKPIFYILLICAALPSSIPLQATLSTQTVSSQATPASSNGKEEEITFTNPSMNFSHPFSLSHVDSVNMTLSSNPSLTIPFTGKKVIEKLSMKSCYYLFVLLFFPLIIYMELSFRDYDFRVYPDNMLTFFNDSNREAYHGQGQIDIISVYINQGGEPTGCECTRANHQDYADRHNYSYILYTKPNVRSKGDVRFNKMAYVIDKIDEKRRKGDPAPILLLDCDVVIMNQEIGIEDVWNMFARKSTDIVIARDSHWHKGSQINSGVILLRPSAWNQALFSDIIALGRVPGSGHVDQPRLIEQLILRGQLNLTPKTEYELNPKVTVISQRNMNAFAKRNVRGVEAALYRENDWMVHLAGFSHEERIKKLSGMGLCQEGLVALKNKSSKLGA